jgi:hypothetical protein
MDLALQALPNVTSRPTVYPQFGIFHTKSEWHPVQRT